MEEWRKSSRTQGQTNCVEIHPQGLVRDSKQRSGPHLRVDLATLTAAIKAGRVDSRGE
ncbi:DUF397 domain-containing protein [Actinophytocola xinjiangensis]|uniref:DUF397 domain-containing protein n=1 Tax=Actinophytocola xinjiangensis TaxID=485602 RepID=UPI000A04BF2D|nr:DUF397 domain-containing protein [Actinophytocola xinjiangensis]